jgi:hypothetical protein
MTPTAKRADWICGRWSVAGKGEFIQLPKWHTFELVDTQELRWVARDYITA